VNYADGIPGVAVRNPGLARELAEFRGVSDVLEWMQRTGRTQAAVDIVGQDEFHYDFLIELKQGGDWLAFGIT
jgi:hypothetical protein